MKFLKYFGIINAASVSAIVISGIANGSTPGQIGACALLWPIFSIVSIVGFATYSLIWKLAIGAGLLAFGISFKMCRYQKTFIFVAGFILNLKSIEVFHRSLSV